MLLFIPHWIHSRLFTNLINLAMHLNGQPREGDGHLLGAHGPLRRLGHDHIQLGSLLEQGFL